MTQKIIFFRFYSKLNKTDVSKIQCCEFAIQWIFIGWQVVHLLYLPFLLRLQLTDELIVLALPVHQNALQFVNTFSTARFRFDLLQLTCNKLAQHSKLVILLHWTDFLGQLVDNFQTLGHIFDLWMARTLLGDIGANIRESWSASSTGHHSCRLCGIFIVQRQLRINWYGRMTIFRSIFIHFLQKIEKNEWFSLERISQFFDMHTSSVLALTA